MTTAAKKSPTAVDHLQHAVGDLDSAREQATQDVRERIDAAIERIRKAAADARERAEHQRDEFEDALEHAGEDVRLELGRRAGPRAVEPGGAQGAGPRGPPPPRGAGRLSTPPGGRHRCGGFRTAAAARCADRDGARNALA